LRAGAAEVGGAVAEAESFRLRTSELEQERRMLEDRLENAKAVAENAKRKGKEEEDKVDDLRRRLGEAERGRKEAEERLAHAGSNAGADNYLKDELKKSRKENVNLQERTRELEKTVKTYKSQIKETRQSYCDSEKVVRTQIPMMSGKQVGGKECGEHVVRIKILEAEAERHIRRIQALEHQIQQIENRTQERVEQLLGEKRAERERDHTRHTQEIKQLEHNLNTRERMYKERISGLEEQVHTLKDQINLEARSRRSFIASSQAISADVVSLRRQLDDSLENVHSRSRIDTDLLERETSRLQETLGRHSRLDAERWQPKTSAGLRFESSRLEPRTRTSVIRSTTGSLDNLDQIITSTPIREERGQFTSASFQPQMRAALDPGARRSSGLRRNLNAEFEFNNTQ